MDEKEYNGYTNRDTWAFNLHISNNEGDYNYWKERTGDIIKNSDYPSVALADEIKKWFEEVFYMVIDREDGEPTNEAKLLVQDVGNGDHINWTEIAKCLIEEHKEE